MTKQARRQAAVGMAREPQRRPLRTKMPTAPSQKRAATGEDTPIALSWGLAELPSSQHRAGLAGLVLMVRWLRQQPPRKGAVCELDSVDGAGASLRVNRAGMRALFDEVYGADIVEAFVKAKWKNKAPLREEVREDTDPAGGKAQRQRYFVYEVPAPRGAFLNAHDHSEKRLWVKLWRDMLWGTVRGVPKTRLPFEERARGIISKDADEAFELLKDKPDRPQEVPSSFFIGTMAHSAEMVPFSDRARHRWLLNFWPFVAQVYIPNVLDSLGSGEFKGYAVAVPDVADLAFFCDELPPMLDARPPQAHRSGFRPDGAVIDLAGEGALAFLAGLRQRVARQTGLTLGDVVLGVDVFHLDMPGNALKIMQACRVEPAVEMVDAYEQVKAAFRNSLFRRQRLLNVLAGQPWHAGFDEVFARFSWRETVGSRWFGQDLRTAFGKGEDMAQSEEGKMEQLIYRFVQAYVLGRVKSKHDLTWESAKESERGKEEFNEKKAKIAREAFLAIRSRTGEDFVSYFAATLGSVPHRLDETQFAQLAAILRERTAEVRTLTMLALCAHA